MEEICMGWGRGRATSIFLRYLEEKALVIFWGVWIFYGKNNHS
jgi:hypothetical protein